MQEEGKRWHYGAGKTDGFGNTSGAYARSAKVEKFLSDIAEVCRRHGFDIEHEDSHGCFIIEMLQDGEEPTALRLASIGASVPFE